MLIIVHDCYVHYYDKTLYHSVIFSVQIFWICFRAFTKPIRILIMQIMLCLYIVAVRYSLIHINSGPVLNLILDNLLI